MFVLCFFVDFWKTYLKPFHLLWGIESHRAYAEGSLELERWAFDDNGSTFLKTPSIFYWSNVFQTSGVGCNRITVFIFLLTFSCNYRIFFLKNPSIFHWSNVFQTIGVLYLVTLQSLVSDFSPFYLTLSSFFSTTFSIGKKILNAKISYFKYIIINLFFYCRGNSPAEELIGEVADDSISNASNVSNDNHAWMW